MSNKQVKLPSEYSCPSRIRDQQTNYASNLVILAEGEIPKCILSLQAVRSKMNLKLRNLNLQLSTSKTLYISLSVICVMQIMSALQADLHQRVEEHKRSVIGNHVREQHGNEPCEIAKNFRVLRKCSSKFDCLILTCFLLGTLSQS